MDELDKKTLELLTEKYIITYKHVFKLSDDRNYYVLMLEDKKNIEKDLNKSSYE